jgi:Neocarzinostatin family
VILLAGVIGLGLVAGLVLLLAVVQRPGVTIVALGAVALGVVVVALAAAMVGLPDNRPSPRDATPTPVAADETAAPSDSPLQAPDVGLRGFDDGALPPDTPIVESVADGQVLVVQLAGFVAGTTGSVHQCPGEAMLEHQCRPGLPVTFDGSGGARVGVEVARRFAAVDGGEIDCDADRPVCAVVVFGARGERALLAFGSRAVPHPRIRVTPRRLASDGRLTATVTGAAPGQVVAVVQCSTMGGAGVACRSLTGARHADGRGSLTARIGLHDDLCQRGHPCSVAVTSAEGAVQWSLASLSIAGRPGVRYEGRRLLSGLLVAAALAVLAAALVRQTDWTPVEGDPFADLDPPQDR